MELSLRTLFYNDREKIFRNNNYIKSKLLERVPFNYRICDFWLGDLIRRTNVKEALEFHLEQNDYVDIDAMKLDKIIFYWNDIMTRCKNILSDNGMLLFSLIIDHGIYTDRMIFSTLNLICKNVEINASVKRKHLNYPIYEKGSEFDCRFNCGTKIVLEKKSIMTRAPICNVCFKKSSRI